MHVRKSSIDKHCFADAIMILGSVALHSSETTLLLFFFGFPDFAGGRRTGDLLASLNTPSITHFLQSSQVLACLSSIKSSSVERKINCNLF